MGIIRDYLESRPPSSYVEHLLDVEANLSIINKSEIDYKCLQICPSNFGLKGYEGECYRRDDGGLTYGETVDMCCDCWKIALEIE